MLITWNISWYLNSCPAYIYNLTMYGVLGGKVVIHLIGTIVSLLFYYLADINHDLKYKRGIRNNFMSEDSLNCFELYKALDKDNVDYQETLTA